MNDIVAQTGSIECDLEAIRHFLENQLSAYKGVIFTEAGKKDAKATVAVLRKQKKDFADRVREVKKEYMKPYEEFLVKAKEIEALFDEPIDFINEELEEFEMKRIDEKMIHIRQIFNDLIGDMSEIIPFDKVFDKKWLNATTTDKAIKADIMEFKESVKSALKWISDQHLTYEAEVIAFYLEDFDLFATMDMVMARKNREAEIQRRVEEAEKAMIDKLAQEKAAEYQQFVEDLEEARAEERERIVDSLRPNMNGDTAKYEFTMELTEDAKEKLEMYLNSVGITYDYNIIF